MLHRQAAYTAPGTCNAVSRQQTGSICPNPIPCPAAPCNNNPLHCLDENRWSGMHTTTPALVIMCALPHRTPSFPAPEDLHAWLCVGVEGRLEAQLPASGGGGGGRAGEGRRGSGIHVQQGQGQGTAMAACTTAQHSTAPLATRSAPMPLRQASTQGAPACMQACARRRAASCAQSHSVGLARLSCTASGRKPQQQQPAAIDNNHPGSQQTRLECGQSLTPSLES